MRKIAAVLFLCLVAVSTSFAQTGIIMESVDPVGDSVTVAKMRSRMAAIRKHRPTVGLVLSGGGAKGAAHVGVLKYLEEQGIPVDMIVGTSMGGLMGGLYSVGYSASEIEDILGDADWDMIMSDKVSKKNRSYERRKYNEKFQLRIPLGRDKLQWTNKEATNELGVFPDGYVSGFNVVNMLSSLTVGYQDSMDFADLPIPFFCVATDLTTLKEYNFTRGSLPEAMRATMSIPLYFTPVRTGESVLIDGGTRNNFPIDIARAMGADIIIGIDLSTTKDKEPVKGVADIIGQSINLMGKQAYDINRLNADLYVHPDMEGMGMMSFDSKSIRTLISRGYDAMTAEQAAIDSIKALVGTPGTVLHNKQAVDIAKTPVLIQSMSYSGMDAAEGQYFFDKSKLMPGGEYYKEEIEEELARIYGTGAFRKVRYAINGSSEPYSLEFNCDKGFIHNMGVNLRADSEEYLALFVNFGFNVNKLCGFKYTVEAKLSANPYLFADVCYTPIHGCKFGLSARTRYFDCDIQNPSDGKTSTRLQDWYNDLNLYIGSAKISQGVIKGGIELEASPYEAYGDSESMMPKVDWKRVNLGVYADLRFDNQDNGYFPTRGLNIGAYYKYVFWGQRTIVEEAVRYSPYNLAKIDISGVIPVVRRFCVIPSLIARFAIGNDIPVLQSNRIGGIIPGRYCESQLPYIGYLGMYECENLAAVLNIDFRVSITDKDFLSATAACYNEATGFSQLKLNPSSYAFGVKYGRNTLIGPVRAHIAWAKNTGVNFYVSAGFDF